MQGSFDQINDLAVFLDTTNSVGIYVAGDAGLFNVTKQQVYLIEHVRAPITTVAYSASLDMLVAGGTLNKMYYKQAGFDWNFVWCNNVVEGNPTGLAFGKEGQLWVGNAGALNARNYLGVWQRFGARQGLPFNQITAVSVRDIDGRDAEWEVWLGHANGAVTRLNFNSEDDDTQDDWRLFYGDRWVARPNYTVTGLVTVNEDHAASSYGKVLSRAYVLSTYGVTVLSQFQTTMRHKADVIQDLVYPRHDRWGLFGDCSLTSAGNVNTWSPHTDDNNGLWTSVGLAGMSLGANLTGNTTLKQLSWHHFQAMQMLNNVTGITGLTGRSFAKIGHFDPDSGRWWNSTTMPGWAWKGDTSSDEIVGHFMIYSMFHDLVAGDQGDVPLKLLFNMIDYIVGNDYQLIGANGQRTTWGFWDPMNLNEVPDNYDERGLNALQIVAWLSAAWAYSGNNATSKYMDSMHYLDANGYFTNILSVKVEIPNDVNHSDDELAGLSYLLYFWLRSTNKLTGFPGAWDKAIQLSWERNYKYLSTPYEALYSAINILAAHSSNVTQDKFWIQQQLQRWPLEHISWASHNSKRRDLERDRFADDRCPAGCATTTLPPDEISLLRWNANPYNWEAGNPNSEQDPGAFLLFYWLSVWVGAAEK
eukprot:NODE_325_length_2089_cov_71.982671_g319_i0.p1 GENE.NODE_325_length_2089_cov_71.982671_g319_i0~~NODE_325_length_2089_cov_71.982671_g319_i0.p1  ORF type:complete len:644 (-),score=148.58 NODE_325_length_2089_cov_71.982671_g319_i0:23-1954(-)